MKDKLLKLKIVGVLIAVLLLIAIGVYRYRNNVKLTKKQAEEIALKHSKASSKAVVENSHLDTENERVVYEIKILDGNQKYDYDIDTKTGEVVSYSIEILDAKNTIVPNNEKINEEKATSIALGKVKGAKKSDIVKMESDFDYGTYGYKGKIIYNNMEYEFKIDANTGNIIFWKEEKIGKY